MYETSFVILSGLCALGSAWYWLLSARVSLPHPVGDSFSGKGPCADAQLKQTMFNKSAATLAAFAAASQAFATLAHVIPK